MKEFKEKVAVITGAASGIGRGLAERCAREGMKVVLADIEEAALREIEQTLKAGGATVLAVRTDVSRVGDIESLAQRTLETFGGVHLLFNNAGVQAELKGGKKVWEHSLADWEWVISVNLWGVIYGLKVFVPIMLEQGTESHIVNTGSVGGVLSGPELEIYGVTKHGIVTLSERLYIQLRQINAPIGVTLLCPFLVGTNLMEAARNRPENLQNPPEQLPESVPDFTLGNFSNANSVIMSPEDFAAQVFDAIRNDRFYVLTEPALNPSILRRVENMVEGRNPDLP